VDVTTWQQFVLEHGRGTRDTWLARVLEQPVAAIRRVRQTGACKQLPKRLDFGQLFARWHGRPPADDEWPAPEKQGAGYEWLQPELTLVARLVGNTPVTAIAAVLTERLQRLTGDATARRDINAVRLGITRLGLQAGADLVGGLTTREAAKAVGSLAIINQVIHNGTLRTIRVGRRHVIPHAEFTRWLSTREQQPEGWVRLASLREALGISSDSKLPEYAALGHIPDVRLVRGIGTARGVWYIAPDRAKQILEDAAAGRPMPWHGKPLPINQRSMWKKWQARKHRWCRTCTRIWSGRPPRTFEEFCARYTSLSLGDKRHLTVDRTKRRTGRGGWRQRGSVADRMRQAGLTVYEAAAELGQRSRWIRTLIREGLFERGGLARDAKGGEAIRITPLGMCMLRVAAAEESAKQFREQLAFGVHAAAQHAGVSIGTIHKWGREGLVMSRPGPRGLLFERTSLEEQARKYWAWATTRFRRAAPPAWLQQEPAA
jgi:hypothetical protein